MKYILCIIMLTLAACGDERNGEGPKHAQRQTFFDVAKKPSDILKQANLPANEGS